jgi:pyrroloquinoline quinone (PQQ) biosynthesis protein C
LREHIDEERGHEEWVLNDLEQLGYRREHVRQSLPARETFAMVGSQFYIINELNPIGFLGYIFALECNPPTAKSIQTFTEKFEVPHHALTVLTGHAEADPNHIKELAHVLDSAVTDGNDQRLIEFNLQMTLENLADLVLAMALRGSAPEVGGEAL